MKLLIDLRLKNIEFLRHEPEEEILLDDVVRVEEMVRTGFGSGWRVTMEGVKSEARKVLARSFAIPYSRASLNTSLVPGTIDLICKSDYTKYED